MAAREAERAYLHRIISEAELFRTASAEDVAELARAARMLAVQRGKAPSKGREEELYIVETGALALLDREPGADKAILIALFGPGDVALLPGAAGGVAREARALSNVTLVALPVPDFQRVRRRSAEISEAVFVALASDLRRLAARFAASLQNPLELRLASFFAELAAIETGNLWEPTANIGRLHQTQIADMLGVSREHINRTLIMWEKSGLIIQTKAGDVIIENRKRLIQLAESRRSAAPADTDFHAEIEAHLNHGLNEAAFDLAMENVKRTPRDDQFKYFAVLAMARMGAAREALSLAETFKLSADSVNQDIASIGPRLRRDLAFAEGGAPDRAMLAVAAAGYEKAFAALKTTYPGVNAAATHAMSGDLPRARVIAKEVGALAASALAEIDEDEPSYWTRATLAECRLIEGDLAGAAADFLAAVNAADAAPGKIGTTRKQLRRLKSCLPIDDRWIDRAAPQGGVLFFCGPLTPPGEGEKPLKRLKQHFENFLEGRNFVSAVGALAAGADILIAESLLDAGIALHVHLPLTATEFMEASVTPSGHEWRERYIACMERAQTIEWMRRAKGSRAAWRLGSRVAMGRTIRLAEELAGTPFGYFAIQRGRTPENSVSLENAAIWRSLGLKGEFYEDDWHPLSAQPKTGAEEDYLSALIIDGAGHAAVAKDLKPAAKFMVAEENATTLAYDRAADALAAARAASAAPAAKGLRLWLDIGVADATSEVSRASFPAALVAAACRPLTPPGKVYASESFAHAAAAAPDHCGGFEYVGVTQTEEKLDPCPLFLVDP